MKRPERVAPFGETMCAAAEFCVRIFPWLFFGGTLLVLLINAVTN